MAFRRRHRCGAPMLFTHDWLLLAAPRTQNLYKYLHIKYNDFCITQRQTRESKKSDFLLFMSIFCVGCNTKCRLWSSVRRVSRCGSEFGSFSAVLGWTAVVGCCAQSGVCRLVWLSSHRWLIWFGRRPVARLRPGAAQYRPPSGGLLGREPVRSEVPWGQSRPFCLHESLSSAEAGGGVRDMNDLRGFLYVFVILKGL